MRLGTLARAGLLSAVILCSGPPMPRLYPGLLDDGDVELIAQYLAILMQANRAR